jgi:signal transduction histidine kinase
MALRIKFGFKLRVFLSYALFFLAALGALTYLTIRSQRNLLLAEMSDRARVGIDLMELSVTTPLYKMDIYNLGAVARQAKALPDVDYAYIYDDKGRIVGDFHDDNRFYLATLRDELSRRVMKSSETQIEIDYKKGILDISKPVVLGHQRLGVMRLGFNLNPVFNEMRAATIQSLAISTAIFLLGALIIFAITKRMTRPIELLTIAAKRIEEGDLGYRVNIKRDDEIGTLSAAFDQMGERLLQRERELKQSQETLRRADRLSSLGLLTAGLAHEIRNPLVAIRTFTQLLPERYDDPEFREGFQGLALKEVDRICGLISDLLSFARPSKPNVAPENVSDVVDNIARILETQAKEKGVAIERQFSDNLPKAWIDREQMKQVFMNLILNAIQAMKGTGKITLSSRAVTKNGTQPAAKYIQIEVKDNGVGIPEENLNHIFDPFFTSKDEGSGLGLAVSHQIVQEHGGFVTVESKVGAGTSFFVHVPVGKPVRPVSHSNAEVNEANPDHR